MPLVVRTLPLSAAALAALVGLLAVVNPVVAVAVSVAIAFGTLVLADLSLGLALFAFSASLFEAVPEFASFSVAKAIGLALVVSWLAALAVRPSVRGELFAEMPGFTALLALLAAWAVASVLWAEDSTRTLSDCLRLALNLMLIPIAFSGLKDSHGVRRLVGALLVGSLASVAYGIFLSPGSLQETGRLEGAGLDPNYLAMWLIIAATLGAGVAARRRAEPAARWLVSACIAACVVAALATGSRTGVVALAAVLLAAPLVLGPRRRAPVLILSITILAVGGLYIAAAAPEAVRERLSESPQDGSGRTDIWKVGLRMVEAHPVRGVGFGNFQNSSIHYLLEPGAIKRSDHIVDHPKVAHNLYLELLAEIGAVGLALYLLVVGFSIWAAAAGARRFDRDLRGDDAILARTVVLAIIAAAAGSAFVSIQYAKPLWLLLALGPIMLHLARSTTPAAGRA